MAVSSMIAVVKSEINKRQEQLNTRMSAEANSATATEVLGKNAVITTENYSTAA
jgi:hypothetical protein